MNIWIAIGVTAVGCYAVKIAGLLVPVGVLERPLVKRLAALLPVALLAALTAQQTFADVPSGNAFWAYVEVFAGRGAISGYACGSGMVNLCTGQVESCDSQARPYFRWCTAITRAQAVKIAANVFYPNCQISALSKGGP